MPRSPTGTDVALYNCLDKIVPTFCRFKIHPNLITLVSFLLNIPLFKYLQNFEKYKYLVVAIILSHAILDSLDGEVARQCNKYTVFGSYFDSINDFTFMIILINYIFRKYIPFNIKNILILSLINLFVQKYALNFDFKTHKFKNNLINDNSFIIHLIFIFVIFFSSRV
jgi:phosphatidylglycerophosphate synthase